jgi:hypothetical protein
MITQGYASTGILVEATDLQVTSLIPGSVSRVWNRRCNMQRHISSAQLVCPRFQYPALMQALGVSDGTAVVAYDSNQSLTAAHPYSGRIAFPPSCGHATGAPAFSKRSLTGNSGSQL